jgi:hypothetical protein
MTEGDPQRIDLLDELDAVLDLGRRAPGSDAERRTANHLRDRLRGLGRNADVESFAVYPAWPLAYVLLAAAAVGASVLSVYVPVAGAALALVTALLTFLDAGVLIPVTRRLFGRRASQNVVSFDTGGKPGAVVLVAHLDAGRAGLVHGERTARRRAALGRALRRPVGGLSVVFWAELAVLACTLLRLVGIDSTALTAVQFVPTLVLIVAIALLADVALAGTKAGENDNASGAVTLLSLAADPPELDHFDVHILFTGAQKAGAAGMRDFLKRHGLPRDSTVVVNVEQVGSGEVRYTRREGALLTQRSHPQLVGIAGEDDSVAPIVNRTASDGHAATASGYAAITVTCRDDFDYASGRVDERALASAERFCAELLERLDAEVGPSIVAPVDATALSEPEAS